MAVPAGFDKEQVKYNVYAFGRDVRKFTRKRDAARKPHTRAHWQKKVDEYTIYLNDNKGWLAELEAAEHSAQSDGAGTLPESGEYFVEYVESNIVRLTPRR